MMREQRGSQFDPLVFDVLEDIARETQHEVHAEGDTAGDEESGSSETARAGDAARCVDRVVRKAGASQDLRAATAPRLPGRRARVRGRARTQRDRGGAGEALRAVRRLAARERLCGRARPPLARRPVRLRGGQGRLRAEARCDGAGDPHADDPARRGRGGEHRLRLLRPAASPRRSRSRSRPGTASRACSTWSRSG